MFLYINFTWKFRANQTLEKSSRSWAGSIPRQIYPDILPLFKARSLLEQLDIIAANYMTSSVFHFRSLGANYGCKTICFPACMVSCAAQYPKSTKAGLSHRKFHLLLQNVATLKVFRIQHCSHPNLVSPKLCAKLQKDASFTSISVVISRVFFGLNLGVCIIPCSFDITRGSSLVVTHRTAGFRVTLDRPGTP